MARIVVVDDFNEALELIREVLEPLDHVVTTFEDGQQALEYLSATETDLLILDIRMPGLDGAQILENLAHMKAGTMPRLILLCGNLEEGHHLSASLSVPAKAILNKPFTITSLMRAVQDALDSPP